MDTHLLTFGEVTSVNIADFLGFRPVSQLQGACQRRHVLCMQVFGEDGTAVMTMARRTSTYVGVALLGGMIGAVLGLLVAPGPGDETRRRIARHSIEDQELLLRRAEMGMDLLWDELDLPASA
jgi:hypothetical protein